MVQYKTGRFVKETTQQILQENNPEIPSNLEEKVIEALPIELWDTWEGADGKIRKIIDDTLMGRVQFIYSLSY